MAGYVQGVGILGVLVINAMLVCARCNQLCWRLLAGYLAVGALYGLSFCLLGENFAPHVHHYFVGLLVSKASPHYLRSYFSM